MTKNAFAGSLAAVVMLCACATTQVPSAEPAPPAAPSVAASSAATGDVHLGTLAPRKLGAGECGMFLWAKTSERNLVFFNPRTGAGRIVLNGKEVELTRTHAEGSEVLGQFETQRFAYGSLAIDLQVAFEQRPGLGRGAVVSQGALRMTRDDGWEYIVPVGGLVGCEDA